MMRKLPESVFEREFDAARENGFSVHLFGEDVRSREGAERALAGLPDGNGTTLPPSLSAEEFYRRLRDASLRA
jgi:hypothetical protein